MTKHWRLWNIKCAGKRHSLRNLKPWLCRSIDLAETSNVPVNELLWGTSTLTVPKHWPRGTIKCASERHSLSNLKLWPCRSNDLTETSSVPAGDIPWETSKLECVEVLTSLKHQVCRRTTSLEEPQTLNVSKHWPNWNIKCAGERHSLRNLKPWLCQNIDLAETSSVLASDIPWGTVNLDCVKALTILKHQVCRRATFPEEPQSLSLLKHWPHWNIKCSKVRHSLRNLNIWLCWSIDLTETSSVLASDIPWGTSNPRLLYFKRSSALQRTS